MDWNILSKYHFNYAKTNILLFRRTKLMQYKYDLYTQNTSDIYTDIYDKFGKARRAKSIKVGKCQIPFMYD